MPYNWKDHLKTELSPCATCGELKIKNHQKTKQIKNCARCARLNREKVKKSSVNQIPESSAPCKKCGKTIKNAMRKKGDKIIRRYNLCGRCERKHGRFRRQYNQDE